MFHWLFFWRRRPTPQLDQLGQQSGTSPHSQPLLAEQNAPESTSMPLEMRSEPNQKSLRTLVVVSSNAAPALETEPDAPDARLKPIHLLPSVHNRPTPDGETTEKQSTNIFPASDEEVADIPETGRAAYFAPGRYVSSEPDRPRLTSPDRNVRPKRKPSKSPARHDIADAAFDPPQTRRLSERK
jgi:hypothetical protein